MTETRRQMLPGTFDDVPYVGFRKKLNRFLGADDREPWRPSIDFFDLGARFVLQAELPGVEKSDVRIDVRDGRLEIRGERGPREPRESVSTDFERERPRGRFRRSVDLPAPVDENMFAAKLENGVLTVSLPKTKNPSSDQEGAKH